MMKYVRPTEEMRLTVINGNVCEGTICGVILTIVAGDVVVDGYRVKHNSEEMVLPATQEFYFDENTFKLGQPIIPDCSWNGLYSLVGWDRPTLWYYKNGKAESWEWKKELISWEILPNYNAKLLNGFIPDELFREQEDVYNWYDLIVHKDNGDVEFKKAPLSVLRLNDKQKELFERYKSILKEMDDSGMIIIEDRDSCNFAVLNCSEYKIDFDYGSDFDPVFPEDMQFVIRNHTYYYKDGGERMNICKKK
jgi:hypothetical protein